MNAGISELPLVAVVGLTASGKSALGVWLAEQFGRAALELAGRVMASIQEHGERVQLAAFASQEKAGK
jgi:shikimate kinase